MFANGRGKRGYMLLGYDKDKSNNNKKKKKVRRGGRIQDKSIGRLEIENKIRWEQHSDAAGPEPF